MSVRGIETSITALLSECPSFKSLPNHWSARGTELHKEYAKDDGIMALLDLVEKKNPKLKVKNILDVEGRTPPDHEAIVVSGLSHRQGQKAYSLTLTHEGHDILITGVPDIVLELEDGRLMIIDHKSGGKIHDMRQVNAYALMASIAWQNNKGAVMGYIHHDMEGDDGDPIVRLQYATDEEVSLIWNDIEMLVTTKMGMGLKVTSLCRYCANKDKCPQIMMESLPSPSEMGWEDKVSWYLANKGRASIQSDTIKQVAEEILSMIDMGQTLPDFATLKVSKGQDINMESLQKDYPLVTWVTSKPLGIAEIRKLAKANGVKLEDYATEKVTARKIELAK